MAVVLKAITYRSFIDPLLSGVRDTIERKIDKGSRVIDIACGTGSLALLLAQTADNVTGIDLDQHLVSYAAQRAKKKEITNVNFRECDATDLSCYGDDEFDFAVTSMSVHQFDPGLAVRVLTEMKRIASKVIIADYNCPLPRGFSGSLAYLIERMARGDHYRNFSNYMTRGGLGSFLETAGMSVISEEVRGNGVFIITVCD